MPQIIVAALYKFVSLPDYEDIQPRLLKKCLELQIKGSLLLAKEGINGTIAGTRTGIDSIMGYLLADQRFSDLEYKESFAEKPPFLRMKVRLKKEIVTLGLLDIDPTQMVGQYVEGKEWNALLSDPKVIVIDTRNEYECDIGTFKNALNPKTKTFREFPKFVEENLDPSENRPIAMFCTGGIRCEKASSYMLKSGFKEVYLLKGGILKYLETTPTEKSLWVGDCFVFDGRTAVTHGLEPGQHDTCFGCRNPIHDEDKKSFLFKEGVHCPRCYENARPEQIRRATARQRQIQIAASQGRKHLGSSS